MTRVRALVIDDDKRFATSMARALATQSFDVEALTDPCRAVERVLQTAPDLVLLDVVMSPVDGVQILRQLRCRGYEGVVFMVSGSNEVELKERAFDLGASDFIVKPTSAKEIIARYGRCVPGAHARPAGGVELRLDVSQRSVTVGEQTEHFTKTEWNLVLAMMEPEGATMEQLRRRGRAAAGGPSPVREPMLSVECVYRHQTNIRAKLDAFRCRLRCRAGRWHLRLEPHEIVQGTRRRSRAKRGRAKAAEKLQ